MPFGEDRITEEYARKNMCEIIERATRQKIPQLESVVLPISGIWALRSVMVQGIEQVLFPGEFIDRKDEMVRYLNNSQEVMQNLTGGQGENVPLSMIEPLKLASMLYDASHLQEFKKRYIPILLGNLIGN